MGKANGFLQYERAMPKTETTNKRVEHFNEFYIDTNDNHKTEQAARCMDCGIPFCHSGCPLGNLIPDFNDAVYRENWKEAFDILSSTNNFPEFTGRICPAPCEAACVLGINEKPVTIEFIEKSITEKAYENGWAKPVTNIKRTGKTVAVVGSGPAGLACADQLNKAGHTITVFERNDRIGGLLRYGIPDFKLGKDLIDRRLKIMEAEGVLFKTNTNVGVDIKADELVNDFDAVVLCGGSTIPRDLDIVGRHLNGIYYAMDYLEQKNRMVAGDKIDEKNNIIVEGKNVVVIGGGDTGSDCIGTSNRLKANSITQIEILGKPGTQRTDKDPWPLWPMVLRTSSSHQEGCDREWALLTKAFVSEDGENLSGIKVVEVNWQQGANGKMQMQEIEGTDRIIPCDLVFLAMGFVHPQKAGLLEQLKVNLTQRGNVEDKHYKTNLEKVFTAGDMRRGQSLVVWAISEGREAAVEVDRFLRDGVSLLKAKAESLLSLG